jgi:hypothetical protein
LITYTFIARLTRMNPKLMRADPVRHMRVMSHPFEMSMPMKTLPLKLKAKSMLEDHALLMRP